MYMFYWVAKNGNFNSLLMSNVVHVTWRKKINIEKWSVAFLTKKVGFYVAAIHTYNFGGR